MTFICISFKKTLKGLHGTLENQHNIGGLHSTLVFDPSQEERDLFQIGDIVECQITGYGNNGKNEGLAIEFKTPCLTGAQTKHITLSVARGESSVNTGYIEFGGEESLREFEARTGQAVPRTVRGVIREVKC